MHRIRIANDEEAVVVVLEGELDAYSAPELTERLDAARADGTTALVVDLSRVSFLDSTALGVVVRAFREARDVGLRARAVLPETSARRIFEITRLDRALPVAASRADALDELRDSG